MGDMVPKIGGCVLSAKHTTIGIIPDFHVQADKQKQFNLTTGLAKAHRYLQRKGMYVTYLLQFTPCQNFRQLSSSTTHYILYSQT